LRCKDVLVTYRWRDAKSDKPNAVPPCTAPQTVRPDKSVPVEVTKH
jgi:hypothetical protein